MNSENVLKHRKGSENGNERFCTVAHVVQTWEVDREGNFLSEISTDETLHGPDNDNIWTCMNCGAEAIISESPNTEISENFISLVMNGEAELRDIDAFVEKWHKSNGEGSLQTILGLTDYEYERWLKFGSYILDEVVQCRKENITLQKYYHNLLTDFEYKMWAKHGLYAIETIIRSPEE